MVQGSLVLPVRPLQWRKKRIRKKVNKILVRLCYDVLYCVRLREMGLLSVIPCYTLGNIKIKRWLVIGSHFVHRYMDVPYRDNNIRRYPIKGLMSTE